MHITSVILELLSDDRYLLWEVRAAAEDYSINDVVEEVINLVKNRIVICVSEPVLGSTSIRRLSAEQSIEALREKGNWFPPRSDISNSIWLERVMFSKKEELVIKNS